MATDPRDSAGYIPWWLLAGASLFFVALAGALAALVIATRPAALRLPTTTAIVIVIPPATAPATPTFQPPAALPTHTPDVSVTAPPPPSTALKPGDYVQVTGTGEAGFLNLRAEASLTSPVNYLALEREVLQIQAGPAEANGFVWWYLVDPATNSRYGWAVQNYLQVVQGP